MQKSHDRQTSWAQGSSHSKIATIRNSDAAGIYTVQRLNNQDTTLIFPPSNARMQMPVLSSSPSLGHSLLPQAAWETSKQTTFYSWFWRWRCLSLDVKVQKMHLLLGGRMVDLWIGASEDKLQCAPKIITDSRRIPLSTRIAAEDWKGTAGHLPSTITELASKSACQLFCCSCLELHNAHGFANYKDEVILFNSVDILSSYSAVGRFFLTENGEGEVIFCVKIHYWEKN